MLNASLIVDLDGMDDEGLTAYSARLKAARVKPGTGDVRTREELLRYAETLTVARLRRAEGNTILAERSEGALAACYRHLPVYAQW
jgi:hypothetical protein